MKQYKRYIALSFVLLTFTIFQSGCGKLSEVAADSSTSGTNDVLEAEIETEVPEAEPQKSDDPTSDDLIAVAGPYGEISIDLPSAWKYEICPQDNSELTIGLYGIRFRPENQDSDWIELVYTDSFGVCGNGLSTEHRTIADVDAEIGTYDEHACWDYIALGGNKKGIVVQSSASWLSEVNDELIEILDTLKFNSNKTEGTAFVYTPESESDDIAYIIPAAGESKIETNWDWLYGSLSKGTYRISKRILDPHNNEYVLYAEFLIAE